MRDICIVFVCNKGYIQKILNTYKMLKNKGKYQGDVCLIIGNDLINNDLINNIKHNIIIRYYPNINFSNHFIQHQKNLSRPSHWFGKRFQYHKFYLFDVFFKQWSYICYIDCGMIINEDINLILEEKRKNKLIANRDGIDNENAGVDSLTPNEGLKLGDQFVKTRI